MSSRFGYALIALSFAMGATLTLVITDAFQPDDRAASGRMIASEAAGQHADIKLYDEAGIQFETLKQTEQLLLEVSALRQELKEVSLSHHNIANQLDLEQHDEVSVEQKNWWEEPSQQSTTSPDRKNLRLTPTRSAYSSSEEYQTAIREYQRLLDEQSIANQENSAEKEALREQNLRDIRRVVEEDLGEKLD